MRNWICSSQCIGKCLIIICYFIWSPTGVAQISIGWNAWANVELSKGDVDSHFFYNQIHSDYKDWRLGVNELNLMAGIELSSTISLNIRGQLARDRGAALNLFQLPLANLQITPKDSTWSFKIGRFVSPFGRFAEQQHPQDQLFINFPLSFSYYLNVAPQLGYAAMMGEQKFSLDSSVVWGSPMLYYWVYSNGLRVDKELANGYGRWTIALTNGTPNWDHQPFSFSNFALIAQIKLQPKYFWEQQFSLSYGSFNQASSLMPDLPLRQLLLGTDFVLGYGFWEFSGEAIWGQYRVPEYFPENQNFSDQAQTLYHSTFAVNVKYEPPFLSGAYLASGLEYFAFFDAPDNQGQWDNNVIRLNLAAGYKITDFLLFRLNYLTQRVENNTMWRQDTWRAMLTVYY